MPRIFCCCRRRSYKLQDGIPKIKYLKEMDRPTILRVLDFCAACYPAKTAVECCGYLERSEKLVWEQKLAVMETLLLILQRENISLDTYVCVFKTTAKLLQQPMSAFTDLQIVGCRVLVRLGFKLPNLVLRTIIEFLQLRTIPRPSAAWCLKQLIQHKEAAIKHSEGFILENFLPVMETATTFSQRLHFSGAFEALASAFVRSTAAEHAPQYLRGYITCKAYLEAPCKNTEEMCRIRERVLLALGPVTPLLPPDRLAVEIPILIREVLYLQASLPQEKSLSLLKPLEQFIRAGVSKACKEAFSPEILTALHNVISAPEPLSDTVQAAQGKAKELLLLLETHQTTTLNAGDQASGIEKPLGPVISGIQKNRTLAPHRGHTERLPKLPSRRNMRHRSLSLKFNSTSQIARRRRSRYWTGTETIRESRSLVPYCGERQQYLPTADLIRESRSLVTYFGGRLPVWPATFASRDGSAPVITRLPHVAGREMCPPLTTSEETLRQRTNLDSETTENEREPSCPDMLETRESTSLIPYDHGRQRQPLWHNMPEMFQSSNLIIVFQIDPSSGTETVTVFIP